MIIILIYCLFLLPLSGWDAGLNTLKKPVSDFERFRVHVGLYQAVNVFARVRLNQSVTLQQGQEQPHEEAINLFSFPLFVLDCIKLRQRKKGKTSSPNRLRISSAWFTQHAGLRSNEILLAGESELTYFTVRNTPRLQMQQQEEEGKKRFSILSHTKSFPFYIALIKRVVNDISPGQLLNMVCFTCKHTYTDKMHATVWSLSPSLSSFSLSHSHLCPLMFSSKSNYFRWH